MNPYGHIATAARITQFFIGAIAVLLVVGPLLSNANVLAFMALGVLALILLGIAGLMELIVVRPARRRAGGSA